MVLAAGSSSRMGPHNKLLTPMPDGRTMIAQTVDNVLASTASPVIVVTGHDDADIRKALADKPVTFVHAVNYADGMAASLRTGIASLPPGTGAVLICLGDMPLVEPPVLKRIIAAYNPMDGREIVLPCFAGQRGNPMLWGNRFFPELLKLDGDTGARQILQRHMEFVAEVPVATDSVLRDFDTPASLAGLAR
nr:nucleotidyltransferase family protein [Acidocella aquatica]